MIYLSRNVYGKKLHEMLCKADDEAFFSMVWAIHAIQSGRVSSGQHYLNFPMEAATSDPTSQFAVHPWKLETLLNEVLAARKARVLPNRRIRMLNCTKFEVIAHAANLLGRLENADDGIALRRTDILRELHRLGQRQFEWQRGLVSAAHLYRSTFIYGGKNNK